MMWPLKTLRAAPDDLARFGAAVARMLNPDLPAVTGLPPEHIALAEEVAGALRKAERPLIVSGVSCGSEALIQGRRQHRLGR